jgi:GNAT superfamily N-acetyltransferase
MTAAIRVASIRHARFAQHPQYCNTQAARTDMLAAAEENLRRAQVFEELPGQAYVLSWFEPVAWHGAPAQMVWVDHLDTPKAQAWAYDHLLALYRSPHFECSLDAGYPALRHALLRAGVGIDSVSMLGDTRDALRRLLADRPVARTHDAVTIRALQPADIDAVVGLSRQVFTQTPEYCWFGALPLFLEERAADLAAAREGVHEVLCRGDRIVGYWSADISMSNFWGRSAGMDFVLLPEVQGVGLARVGYRRLLEQLVDAGVEVFRGGTNQPPVMHLARVMGRRPWQYWMRTQVPFSADHFAPLDGTSRA